MSTIITVIITTLTSAAVTGAITYTLTIKGKVKAVANGMLACLRADMIAYHSRYMKQGYCPIYAKDAIEKCYQAYHDLGGNGTITKIYNDLMALPTEPPIEKIVENYKKMGGNAPKGD